MRNSKAYKILILEREEKCRIEHALYLNKLGHKIIGIHSKAEDALLSIRYNQPDVVLVDAFSASSKYGLKRTLKLAHSNHILVILISERISDESILSLPYPQQLVVLENTSDLASLVRKIDFHIGQHKVAGKLNQIQQYPRRFVFARQKDRLIKIFIDEICAIKANGNSALMILRDKELAISHPLNYFEQNFADSKFIRVHRSYLVNIDHIKSMSLNKETLSIAGQMIPVSRRNRKRIRQIIETYTGQRTESRTRKSG